MATIDAGALPACSLAVVTNFSTITSERAAPLIAAGFTCLTECYLGDNPNATPDNLDATARMLGWPASQPVFGVYNAPTSTYAPWADWPGADYLAEYVL